MLSKPSVRSRGAAPESWFGAVALVLLAACGADPGDVPSATVAAVAVAVETVPAGGTEPAEPADPVAAPAVVPVTPTGVVVRVQAQDNLFRAPATAAKVGDTVQFSNVGRNDHDVIPKVGQSWGVVAADFVPGDVYEHIFDTPGVYEYYCTIHGTSAKGMVGTITVTD